MKLSERLEKLEAAVDNLTIIVFDFRDNHLKHLADDVTRLDEKTKWTFWLSCATFVAIVLGILGTLLLKYCFNLAI